MREGGGVWGFRGLKFLMPGLAGRNLEARGVCGACNNM